MADTSPPPRQASSPRAAQILSAARLCFGRFGFHAASMARIAAEAGISVGHIYRYFESKEAVVAAIAEEDLLVITNDLQTLSGGPDEMAVHILDHFERTRSREKAALWLEVMAEGARNPKIAAMIQDSDRRIRERLFSAVSQVCEAQCAAGQEIDPSEAETRMSLIGLMMDGLQLRAFQEGEALSPALMNKVRAILAQTLSPAPITIDAPVEPTVAPG